MDSHDFLKVAIVDDEKYSVERIQQILTAEKTVTIIGCYNDSEEAIDEINKLRPDLVFLDIEMPAKNGFDVLSEIEFNVPLIVFVTAFSKYAVRAFEVNAFDYIHKPIDEERVLTIIEKAKYNIRYKRLLANNKNIVSSADQKNSDRFVLKSGKDVKIIGQYDIEWVESSGNYVKIVFEKKKYMIRSTLSGLLEQLDQNKFYQIHKSTFINLDCVDKFVELLYGDYNVIMKDGTELRMSRSYNGFLKKMEKESFN
ncbi:LytTR family DNA-binding domain-containing protein [Gracilimonas sp.]|uniref:LytR/AlgR family response regulator transcription factor n=1 Tax=Gracilimonas sp. TaxID=1974203 RepID=UPI0032EFB822